MSGENDESMDFRINDFLDAAFNSQTAPVPKNDLQSLIISQLHSNPKKYEILSQHTKKSKELSNIKEQVRTFDDGVFTQFESPEPEEPCKAPDVIRLQVKNLMPKVGNLFDVDLASIQKAKQLLESQDEPAEPREKSQPKKYKMKSLFDVSSSNLAKARKLLSSQESPSKPRSKTKPSFRMNSLFDVSKQNLEKAKKLLESQNEGKEDSQSIRDNFGERSRVPREENQSKHQVISTEIDSSASLSRPRRKGGSQRKDKYVKPIKKVQMEPKSRRTYHKRETKQRRKTLNLKKKTRKTKSLSKKAQKVESLEKLSKIKNIANKIRPESSLTRHFGAGNNDGFSIEKIKNLFNIEVDVRMYRQQLEKFGVVLSKISNGWLRHHSKMISYKLQMLKHRSGVFVDSQQKSRILMKQLLFRYWKEFKKRSDSILYKLLKREISGIAPMVLRLNHFEVATGEFKRLRVHFSDGWYLVYHEIRIDLARLDWNKIYVLLDRIANESQHPQQVKMTDQLRFAIVRMITNDSKKLTNQHKNDVELLLLIISGKIIIGQKILFTGIEFAAEVSAEDVADREAFHIDGRVNVSINHINPLDDQDIKLGLFKGKLLPSELKVNKTHTLTLQEHSGRRLHEPDFGLGYHWQVGSLRATRVDHSKQFRGPSADRRKSHAGPARGGQGEQGEDSESVFVQNQGRRHEVSQRPSPESGLDRVGRSTASNSQAGADDQSAQNRGNIVHQAMLQHIPQLGAVFEVSVLESVHSAPEREYPPSHQFEAKKQDLFLQKNELYKQDVQNAQKEPVIRTGGLDLPRVFFL